MKPKTMILMVVAVVCGLGAAYMTSNLLAQRQSQENAEKKKVKVLIAKTELVIGQRITKKLFEKMFDVKEYPAGVEPQGALTNRKDIEEKFLNRHLRKGDHVTAQDLVEHYSSLNLPHGQRAVGVKVSQEAIASGWASLPGNRVDVLWLRRGDNRSSAKVLTLLEKVLVLAADGRSDRNGEKGTALANVVTVALSPEDSRKITLAQGLGDLKLILRGSDDDSYVQGRVLTEKQLMAQLEKNGPPVKKQPIKPSIEEIEKKLGKKKNNYKRYLVDITENGSTRTEKFLLDKDGKIIRPEAVPPRGSEPVVIKKKKKK